MTDERVANDATLEADLVAWGKVIRIETRGRRSGLTHQATIGFVDGDTDVLLVAAADDGAQWAQNLIADASCRVERDGVTTERRAQRLAGEEHSAVISRLILKYGTPAERQGNGPAFRLELAKAT